MENIVNQRQAFEDAYRARYPQAHIGRMLGKDDGQYKVWEVQYAWEWWQASAAHAQQQVALLCDDALSMSADIRKDLMNTKFGCLQLDSLNDVINQINSQRSGK